MLGDMYEVEKNICYGDTILLFLIHPVLLYNIKIFMRAAVNHYTFH